MSNPSASNGPISIPGWTLPEPYEPNLQDVLDIYDSVARGDWVGVTLAIGSVDLSISAYEMRRLSALADHYGPLESGADSLSAMLQAHTKDGPLGPLSNSQISFLDEAVAVFKAKHQNIDPSILSLINKIKTNQSISQEDAVKLYGWCTDAKLVTIPRQVSSEQLAQLAKGEKDKHDSLVNKIAGNIRGWASGLS